MPTSAHPSTPRAVRIHRARMAAVAAVMLPFGLAACGVVGDSGGDDTKAPVIIPSEALGDVPPTAGETGPSPSSPSLSSPAGSGAVSVPPAGTASVSPGTITGSPGGVSAVAAAPPDTTVTTTDVVVRRETRVRTSKVTLPAVTKTPPPVTQTQTQTQTQTETRTETQTLISVLPAKTVTKTATKTVTKTVTKK